MLIPKQTRPKTVGPHKSTIPYYASEKAESPQIFETLTARLSIQGMNQVPMVIILSIEKGILLASEKESPEVRYEAGISIENNTFVVHLVSSMTHRQYVLTDTRARDIIKKIYFTIHSPHRIFTHRVAQDILFFIKTATRRKLL